MYCVNWNWDCKSVLCREVCYTVSLFGRVHYQRFHCTEMSNNTQTVITAIQLVPKL